MNNVIQLIPCADVVTGLRNIADSIESSDQVTDECTLIMGKEVYHLGQVDDAEAASSAIFNMTVGIHVLMKPVIDL